jgi:hypothetical protein
MASRDLRPDVDPMDMLRAIYGVSSAGSTADWPAKARRFVDILASLKEQPPTKIVSWPSNHEPKLTRSIPNPDWQISERKPTSLVRAAKPALLDRCPADLARVR